MRKSHVPKLKFPCKRPTVPSGVPAFIGSSKSTGQSLSPGFDREFGHVYASTSAFISDEKLFTWSTTPYTFLQNAYLMTWSSGSWVTPYRGCIKIIHISPGATSGVVCVVPCPVTAIYVSLLMLASVCSGGLLEPIGSIAVMESSGTGESVRRGFLHSGSCAFSFSVSISQLGRWSPNMFPKKLPHDDCCDCGLGCGSTFCGITPGSCTSICVCFLSPSCPFSGNTFSRTPVPSVASGDNTGDSCFWRATYKIPIPRINTTTPSMAGMINPLFMVLIIANFRNVRVRFFPHCHT